MKDWDNIKMAQQFLRQSNALSPQEAKNEGRYEEELARQELLDECYMSSFSREKLMEMLQRSVAGNVKFPEDLPEDEMIDRERYRVAFVEYAKHLLREMER